MRRQQDFDSMERHSAIFLLIFSLVCSGIGSGADAYDLPFHPRDLLPLLPASIAMPVLKNLHSAVDLLPQFVGAVSSGNDTVVWNGTCFYQNEAYMEYIEPKEEGHNGGGILHIQVCCTSTWLGLNDLINHFRNFRAVFSRLDSEIVV